MATQFFSQNLCRWPVANRMRRGEPMIRTVEAIDQNGTWLRLHS